VKQTAALVDLNGRVFPEGSERVYSVLDRRYFCLEKHDKPLPDVYQNYIDIFGTQLLTGLDLDTFVTKIHSIQNSLKLTSSMSNLLSGVSVPFILPKKDQIAKAGGWDFLIGSVKNSFEKAYPEYEFKNIHGETLNVEVIAGSRWETLDKKSEQGPVVGLYFPTALSGFAIPDHLNVVNRLDPGFVLSGIPEVACALVGSPGLLMKSDGKYPNLLALTSFKSRSESEKHFFWFFEAYGWNLYFNRRSMIGAVSEYYSGGLTLFE
jgi:hypothetical protein